MVPFRNVTATMPNTVRRPVCVQPVRSWSPAVCRKLTDPDTVTLDRLQRFYVHPVRFYLREQLGIHLEESEELLEIHEPFVASKLDNYHLREAFFTACKDDLPVEETVRRLRARGWLPHGVAGELAAWSAHAEALAPVASGAPVGRGHALAALRSEFR